MGIASIVVIISLSAIILGQGVYQRYFNRNREIILAEFDPNMEMGPLI